MGMDEKLDLLRQMIEGEDPTKLIRRKDDSEEFVNYSLEALIADAKRAGEFDGSKVMVIDPGLGVTFRVLRRNHPIPPREWLERAVVPEIVE